LYQDEQWGPCGLSGVDMHDWGDMLVRAGFADPVMDQEVITLRWSHAEAALQELRLWGGNLSTSRFAGLRTPAWRKRLLDALQARSHASGGVSFSFEVVYGHAFKPVPRQVQAGVASVSLDAMRAQLPSRKAVPPAPSAPASEES
jgi:malonyl-CoA O-methyltransferase